MSTLVQRSALDGNGLPLDQIQIRGIAARGFHGVLESEREEGQDFSADVTLFLDTRKAARGDDLEWTVNYALVSQDVTDILSGPPVNLIETLAEQIAAAVLERDLVLAVEVTIHKPQAPIPVPFDDVVVIIHRDRVSPPAVPSPFVSLGAADPEPLVAEPFEAIHVVDIDEMPSEGHAGRVSYEATPVDVAGLVEAEPVVAALDDQVVVSDEQSTTPATDSGEGFADLPHAGAGVDDRTELWASDLDVEDASPVAIAVSAEVPPIPGEYLAPVRPALLTPLELLETRELSIDTAAVRRRVAAAEIPPLDEAVLAEQARLSEQARRPEVFGLKPVAIPELDVPAQPLPPANPSALPVPFEPARFETPPFADPIGSPPPAVPSAAAEEPALHSSTDIPAEEPTDADRTMVRDFISDEMDARPEQPVEVVLALGANLGDAQETLRRTVTELGQLTGVEVLEVGPLARTAAVGVADQPDFLNTVVLVSTILSARELLHACQSIEAEHGRRRDVHWGPRTLDIDIIVFGSLLGSATDLDVPHPRANERAFVLAPWAHIAPDAVLPGLGGGPVTALAATAPDRDGIRWLALDWLYDDEEGHGLPVSIAPVQSAPPVVLANAPIVVPGSAPVTDSTSAPSDVAPDLPSTPAPEPDLGAWPAPAGTGGFDNPPVEEWRDPAIAADHDAWVSRFAPPIPADGSVPGGPEQPPAAPQ